MNTMMEDLTKREKKDLNKIEDALDTLKYMIDDVKGLIDDYRDEIDDPESNETLSLISEIKYNYKEALKAILRKADSERRYWDLTTYERDTLHTPDQYV